MANTAWNPSDKAVGITLSGANLIATNNNNAVSGVRAIDKQVTGKFYWEVTFTTVTYAADAAGIINGSYTLTNSLGGSPLGSPIFGVQQNGSINGGLVGASLGTVTSGSVVCLAIDAGNGLAWFRVGAAGNWNGSATANPATGAGGYNILPLGLGGGAISIYPWCSVGNTNDKMTANFGDSAFTGAVPSGFTSGFTAGAAVATNALVTQASTEQFVVPNPQAQVTQVSVEHFVQPSPILQVTQAALEEWAANKPAVQVTQAALEEWTWSKFGTTVVQVTQAALEEWVSATTPKILGAGEVDAAAAVTGAGQVLTIAPGAGEVDAGATVTGVGAITTTGRGEVDAGATVTGTGAAIPVVTGAGEADAAATVTGEGFIAAIGTGEVDASADVRGMGQLLTPPGSLPFVPGIGWSVHRRPTFNTIVASHPSGSEVRLALWQNCLWEFELTYDALASNDAYPGVWTDSFQTILGFYLVAGGQRGTFLFIDPDFNAMVGQGIGAGDGTTLTFPFYRVFGGQVEPVSWVTATAAIYLDGVAQPSGWTVSGNVVSFAAAPASGVVISADCSYGFICRFLEDSIDFEEFMDNLWQLKSLKFRQVRQ